MAGRVEPVADYLRTQGLEVDTFKVSRAARAQWNEELVAQYPDGVPDEVAKTSLMFKENQAWIEKVRREGYTILDIGEGAAPNRSTFFEMEKQAVYGRR